MSDPVTLSEVYAFYRRLTGLGHDHETAQRRTLDHFAARLVPSTAPPRKPFTGRPNVARVALVATIDGKKLTTACQRAAERRRPPEEPV